MIQGFKSRDTEAFFNGRRVPRFEAFRAVALRKLDMLDVAKDVNDLRVPPGNRLESLIGDRQGAYSIRINKQWRVCFVWTTAGPDEVEIVDNH